jgi:hypothetical protein
VHFSSSFYSDIEIKAKEADGVCCMHGRTEYELQNQRISLCLRINIIAQDWKEKYLQYNGYTDYSIMNFNSL